MENDTNDMWIWDRGCPAVAAGSEMNDLMN